MRSLIEARREQIGTRRANERSLADRVRLEVAKLEYLGEVVGEMCRLREVAASLLAEFELVRASRMMVRGSDGRGIVDWTGRGGGEGNTTLTTEPRMAEGEGVDDLRLRFYREENELKV